MRSSLRVKTLLICSFLLLLPWLGYRYIWEMEKVLRVGQERNLLGTAQALATALHERPQLFDSSASFQRQVVKGKDLYAYELHQPITLDGQLSDWAAYREHFKHYGRDYVQYSRFPYKQSQFSFEHMLGRFGEHLYAVFEVTDPITTVRRQNALRIDRNDHLVIAFTSPEGNLLRYAIPAQDSGWVNAYAIEGNIQNPLSLTPAPFIQGYWQETELGYTVEIRIPLDKLDKKLAFAWYNVNDDFNRDIETVIATASINAASKLGSLVIPSPEIDKILKGMTHSQAHLKVIDNQRRVLAKTGSLHSQQGLWANSLSTQESLINRIVAPFYEWLFPLPSLDVSTEVGDDADVKGLHVTQALEGRPYVRWRRANDNQERVILSAAHPIYVNGRVMGAVVAEETNVGIQTLKVEALKGLFSLSTAIIVLGITTLLLFASHISSRIRRLRDNTEKAIDTQGRLQEKIVIDQRSDEIGDLSRGLSTMLDRLDGYHQYLEQMSSRLAHELRTPVAVVRSSLENLAFCETNPANTPYIQRAQEGINRLNTLLSLMTEATRIEQSLEHVDQERFLINELLEGCTHGYSLVYPETTFDLSVPPDEIYVDGSPDHLVQCLDKLISNSVDFHYADTPVKVELIKKCDRYIQLSISNEGPLLPDEMQDQLFNSMVSLRTKSKEFQKEKQDKPHLGLGLYIARLIVQYHKGEITIDNSADGKGITVNILLPFFSQKNTESI